MAAVVSACGGSPPPGEYRPVATVRQVMDGIVIPSSQAIFDAVVYENGALVRAPRGDDAWNRLQLQALAVAEGGNLLLMPGRARDDDWKHFARQMTDAAVKVAKAAESKDVEGLLDTGGEMYQACQACHATYLPKD